MRIHLDFELAGALDLTKVGADVWTKDPDTSLFLVGYAIDNEPADSLFTADTKLLDAINAGAEIHAWNAPFEWAVWNNILAGRHGYPKLPIERFHCTMAAAANVGLPMNLGDAALAVGAPFTKDDSGHRLMRRMARPRAYDAQGLPRWWHLESPEKLADLQVYNMADVEAERAVSRRIPRMSARERAIWLTDQRMNQRGMPVDNDLLNKLHVVTQTALNRLNDEVAKLTAGIVTSFSQNARLLVWLQARGYPTASLGKMVLSDFIGSPAFYDLDLDAQKVLLIRREAAKTSTAKLRSIAAYSQHDGRARNLVQYAGAVRTLRWAGRGPQIQNFPRSGNLRVDLAIKEILAGMDAEGIEYIFGKPLDVVSACLRGIFKALPGFKFVVCDFKSIEAVVLAWLAEFKELLDVFRRGEDVYIFTANAIGSTNRQLGKVLRLACGFGMGGSKFYATAAGFGLILSPEAADEAVKAFRNSNRPIVSFWYRCETAARMAIGNPGESFPVGPVVFRMANPNRLAKGALLVEKPGGGYLVYRDAHFDNGDVCYWGVDQYTRKWSQIRTYGGKLAENITQAIARDLLAEVMVQLENAVPGALLATIHDEIVAMPATKDAGPLLSLLKLWMGTAPSWAKGMPLSAEGYVSDRYVKVASP